MKKLILMQGLPGSMKSTVAKKLVADGKGRVVRVNKDELRSMIFAGIPWQPKQESLVVEAQKAMVEAANLCGAETVVVDDTNFNPKLVSMWEGIAKNYNSEFVIHKMDTPIDVCIANDLKRKSEGGRYVGADVIRNMAFRYGLAKQEKPFVIFDLDGTLCDISERKKAATRPDGKLDYGVFFDPKQVKTDKPRHDIINKMYEHRQLGHEIVIMSGRSDRTKEATLDWLVQWGATWDRLIMRPASDSRDDVVLKLEFLDKYVDASKCVKVYDDRPKLVRAWKSRGLEVEDCGDGVEF